MQDPLLHLSTQYLRYRTTPPRVIRMLPKPTSLLGLALVGAIGTTALVAIQCPTPGVSLFLGVCIGAAARDLGMATNQRRYWPVFSQLLDWSKIEEVTGKARDEH